MTNIYSTTGHITLDDFICPISGEVFAEPVMLADGYLYERDLITEWLEKHDTSPMTLEKLPNKYIIHAIKFKCILNNFIAEHPEIKELQYVKTYSYKSNKADIIKILTNKNYEDLLKYNNFILKDKVNVGATEYTFIYHVLLNKLPDDIIIHLIRNCNDPNDIDAYKTRPLQYICNMGSDAVVKEGLKIMEVNFTIVGNYPLLCIYINRLKFNADSTIVQSIINITNSTDSFYSHNNIFIPVHSIANYCSLDILKMYCTKFKLNTNDNIIGLMGIASKRGQEFTSYLNSIGCNKLAYCSSSRSATNASNDSDDNSDSDSDIDNY